MLHMKRSLLCIKQTEFVTLSKRALVECNHASSSCCRDVVEIPGRGARHVASSDCIPARKPYSAATCPTHSMLLCVVLSIQDEREVLGAIPYAANDVYLHTDRALMPVTTKVNAAPMAYHVVPALV